MSHPLCRLLGHRWMVRWRDQETPLWASQMLIAVTGLEGVAIECGRCQKPGHPLPESPPEPEVKP